MGDIYQGVYTTHHGREAYHPRYTLHTTMVGRHTTLGTPYVHTMVLWDNEAQSGACSP